MIRFVRNSLVASVAAACLCIEPAAGQVASSRLEIGGRSLAVSQAEMRSLSDLGQALTATPAIQDRALAAARAAANSPDARYVLAIYQFEIGQRRRDDALRAEALDVLIATRDTPQDRLAGFLGLRGDIAFRARDYATASAMWTRLAEMRPNDPQALANLAQVRAAQNDGPAALDLMRRATAARGAESGPAPEAWLRQRLSIAFNGRMTEESAAEALALVAAYPTPQNWRIALVAYRQLALQQPAAEIDLLRLMRFARVFSQPAEYQRLAQLLLHAGFLPEARATLDEGLSRGVLSRSQSPTPEIIAELDRHLARPRPPATPLRESAPAALIVRRGAALASAGDRAGAEAAFSAAAQGTAQEDQFYVNLARFWLALLAQRPAIQAAATR